MKPDSFTKAVLLMIAFFLFLNLMTGFIGSKQAQAVPDNSGRGRYEISSWAAYIGTYGLHSGYYILDTVSGKVVEAHRDIQPITKEIPTEPGYPTNNKRNND